MSINEQAAAACQWSNFAPIAFNVTLTLCACAVIAALTYALVKWIISND